MRKILTFIFVALLPLLTNAYDAYVDGIYYNFSGDEAEVTRGGFYTGSVVIPETVTYNANTYSVTRIGDSAFSFYPGLTSVTIPSSVTSIGNNAFQACTSLTSVTVESDAIMSAERTRDTSMGSIFGYQVKTYIIGDAVTNIGISAFRGCSNITSVIIGSGVTSIGDHAFDGCKSLSSLTIGSSVTSIGDTAFENCKALTSITLPESVNSIANYAFTGCSGLTSVTFGSGVTSIGKNACGKPNNAKFYVKNQCISLVSLWNAGYEGSNYDIETNERIVPFSPLKSVTASSMHFNRFIDVIGAEKLSEKLYSNNQEVNGLKILGLDPDTEFNLKYSVSIQYGNKLVRYEKVVATKTEALNLVTKQPKVISEGNIIVAAQSSLDDEETNVGFEWRRTDWTDDFDSKTGGAYLYEGMMEGYIRSLNSNYLWKFRPYYTSGAGNSYYGEWKGMDPSDFSYFEPTVHTYATINVDGNSAEVKGYVMRGTDNITSQGFMYWSTNHASSRRYANSIPSDAKTILASGNVMTATLEDLEYDTEYCCVAFVTTSEGETFYGESQIFQTCGDPDGINDVNATEEVTEVARYDLSGRKLSAPQKGINIIRYSDGTSKKVLVK